jgi:hypothetical protein
MYLLWKDDGSTMTWDHFRWDQIVVPNHKMKNIKIPGNNQPDDTLPQIAGSVIAGATGKAELAGSPVTLVELGDQRDDLDEAFDAETQAKEAWLTKRVARRDAAKVLRVSLKRYAQYANLIYMGDVMSLQALGLTVIDDAPLAGVLPAPTNLRSRPGKLNGTVNVLWNSVRARQGHSLECAEDTDGPWTEVYRGRTSRATCGNLVSGKQYFFRVRAYGLAGFGAWSDITSARAS